MDKLLFAKNTDKMKNMENMKSKNKENPQSSKFYSFCFQKKLLLICFIIYICLVCLICKKIFSKSETNKSIDEEANKLISFDISDLNYIEEVLASLDPNVSYKGPVFPDDGNLTKEWVLGLLDYMKDLEQKKSIEEKYLDRINLLKMLIKAKKIFGEYQEALIDVEIPEGKNITVVGDIHGQYYDLLHIFEINGFPSEDNIYIFNGDYVDRGLFGVECIITLISLKILYPNYMFMNRGNHEDKSINNRYGFKFEVLNKFDDIRILDCFNEFYKFLPLGHILNKEILVLHGGLFSKDGVTLDELKQINRFIDVPSDGLMCELLWSDPYDGNGTIPSSRGAGVYFGPDVTEKFLRENNLKLLIRSHEVRDEGYSIETGGQVITVFSAPNYCDQEGNKGALIKYDGGDMSHPYFIKFLASPHPDAY
jgi:serine/threonine-protein phosphatase 5